MKYEYVAIPAPTQSKRIKGAHLERVQAAFRSLADGIESDSLPVELRAVRTKKRIEEHVEAEEDDLT